MTAQLAAFRTDRVMNIDLSVPIWTIDHVAAALHLEVDTAREYTYRDDVLTWFAALPTSRRAAGRTSTSTVAVRSAQAGGRATPPRTSCLRGRRGCCGGEIRA
ncbi:hypothetical protein [Nocardioides aestuarii]